MPSQIPPTDSTPKQAKAKWMRTASVGLAGVVAGILIALQLPAFAEKASPPSQTTGLPIQDLRTFAEVFNAIKQGYVEPVEDKKLINNAISGMVSNLDPHSTYLDAEAFKELQVGTHGEFGGLGIEVGMEDGFVKVIAPIEDTPAARAGLKTGDLIVKIDDTAVKGLTLNEAVKKLRGKPKTQVTLTIARKGMNKPLVVTLTREVIKVQSVKFKMLEPGYGYVRITQFQETTISALVNAVNQLYKNGPLKGLILDLRNDPGGLLNAAVGVSAVFLPPDDLVVSTDGRAPDAKHKFYAKPEDYQHGREDDLRNLPAGIKTVPMIVLVNGGSASASEIVAGALQDYKRATVLGTQTFGKGSVQTVLPLPGNTAIKITTARYYTPKGRSIQAKGIEPDVEVEETPGAKKNGLREADLGGHLVNEKDKDAKDSKPEADKANNKNGKNSAKDDDMEPGLAIADYTTAKDRQFVEAIKRLGGTPPVAANKDAKVSANEPAVTEKPAKPVQ
ncbi:peptidase S41 [Fluviibacter phosphoraccumulans]|jgi:carboxyl-terminal processing protease|uniref:Peptidase S41 n=2 Tax=Fluviibacter phosphoraccumulans TaxID=1751046 RepID=A0A679I2I1_9RHOO|nr:peptidase S41 [Fluviibacter phosphoraccumulans]BCA64543.1 peptidase S41 [Fluviibacter phosphoraccumulans]